MVTGLVVSEVEGCSDRRRERFRVKMSLAHGSRSITRVAKRTSTRPNTTYANSAGRSLLRSIEKMQTEIRENKAHTMALKEELKWLRPLRSTSIDIRSRFFAIFRRGGETDPDDPWIIKFGNEAAHSGDVETDVSLFRHNFLDFEETFKKVYGLDWGEAEGFLGMLLDSSTPVMIISLSDIACY